MEKALSEMTKEELWELFPIFLVPHSDKWARQYAEMASRLRELLSGLRVSRISHIGSTSVEGIWAKNIVDILLEIEPGEDMERAAVQTERGGFTRMSAEPGRISLNRGYTVNGFSDPVYHLHIRYTGDNDELYFRDYLRDHPAAAREYEELKLRLWRQFEHNRDAYTEAKTAFIASRTAEAKRIYGARY